MQHIAVDIADLPIAQLSANVGVREGRRTEINLYSLGLAADFKGVRADGAQLDRAAQFDGLSGIECLNAVGLDAHRLARGGHAAVADQFAVNVLHGAVVVHRNDRRRKALSVIFHGRGNLNFAVAGHRTGLDGHIRVRQLLLVHRSYGRTNDLALGHIGCGQHIPLHGMGHVAALRTDRTGILMGQVNCACAYGRVIGHRAGVAVCMACQHHIDMTCLGYRCNVHLGVRVGNRVMHDQNAELFILIGCQIVLQPLYGLFNFVRGCCVHLPARGLGVHLEQRPRVAVHQVEMNVAVVKRDVALNLRTVFLGLGIDDIHIKVIAEIMVAASINHRIIVDKFAAVEPERILLLLRAGAFHHIAAVNDEGGIVVGNRLVKGALGVKLVRIRNRHITHFFRVFLQRAEGAFAACAACQRHLIIIPCARLQIGKFVPENVCLHAAVCRCGRIALDGDGFTQCISVRAPPDGGRIAGVRLPHRNHAVRLGREQIRPDNEFCLLRCERSRHQCCNHRNGQQQAEQPLG